MNNILSAIFVLFCAVVAINTVFGLVSSTFTLFAWVLDNLEWLWLPGGLLGLWWHDAAHKKG